MKRLPLRFESLDRDWVASIVVSCIAVEKREAAIYHKEALTHAAWTSAISGNGNSIIFFNYFRWRSKKRFLVKRYDH